MKDKLFEAIVHYKILGRRLLDQMSPELLSTGLSPDLKTAEILVNDLRTEILGENCVPKDSHTSSDDPKDPTDFKSEILNRWDEICHKLEDHLKEINHREPQPEDAAPVLLLKKSLALSFCVGRLDMLFGIMTTTPPKIGEKISDHINNDAKNVSDESQNASPVCFAQSPEVRDEYREG